MDYLKELIAVFTKEKFYNPDISDEKGGKNSILKQYFQLLKKKPKLSDNEYSKILFGKRADKNFSNLKGKLKQKLLNLLCLLDLGAAGFSLHSRKIIECHRNLYLARILIALGVRDIAIAIVEESLPIAEKYEVFEVAQAYCKILNYHYSLKGMVEEELWAYEKLMHYCDKLKAYYHSCHLLYEIEAGATAVNSLDFELAAKAAENIKEIKKLMKKFPCFAIERNYCSLKYYMHQQDGDAPWAISALEQEKELLDKYPHLTLSIYYTTLYIRSLFMYWKMGNVEKASDFIPLCEANLTVGFPNWYSFKEFHYRLLMLQGEYKQALELVEIAKNMEEFRTLDPKRKMVWETFELMAFTALNLFTANGPEFPGKEIETKATEIYKNCNEQKGLKVPLRVIRILYYLQWQPYEIASGMAENVSTYNYRYLNQPETRRSWLFFSLVYKHLNTGAKPKKIQNMKAEMKQVFEKSGYETFELIPYELLLQWVESLKLEVMKEG